jgi:DNA polymerase-3 subunit epsilon
MNEERESLASRLEESGNYWVLRRLKERGYRWNDGSDARLRSWWSDLQPDALEGELAFLRAEIFQHDADIPVRRVTAVDRFSDRA